MGKAVVITPVYFSFAWALILTYQLFTETAVNTIIRELYMFWPQVGVLLNTKIEAIVFVVAFSWVFLLSSVIPSVILGKRSGTIAQFFVVLILTSSTFFIKDIVTMYTGLDMNTLLSFNQQLMNPLDAFTYLVIPYLVMSMVDLVNRR
jgi:hypothetical protein